ncbi:MAG: nicotinate-nucleotide adenylyltransferase [Nitrospira sp.]|nr:nicotinate-nucleotide adenylyltransferase [Nitrospira sp.]
MKVGLFGGTFNPIHVCHLAVAAQCRDRLHLDRVLFIPSGDPPHKPSGSLAPARHRVEMVRRAIAGEPAFSVSEIEVRRTSTSYSIETVRALRADQGPEAAFFFIIGLDAFFEFPTWKEPGELLRLCHFVVVSRPPCAFRSLAGLALLPPVDSAALAELDAYRRDRVDAGPSGNAGLTLLALPPCDASASEIRRRIRTGRSPSNLLPASVESYIIHSHLYQEDPDRTGVEG